LVLPVQLENLVRQENQGHLGLLVFLENLVVQEKQEKKGHQVHLDHKEKQGYLELQVYQASQEKEGCLGYPECLDLKVKVDLLGQLGLKVPRDNKGNQEEKGHLDNKEE